MLPDMRCKHSNTRKCIYKCSYLVFKRGTFKKTLFTRLLYFSTWKSKKTFKKFFQGVLLWLRGLGIKHCHCSGLDHCCGMGLILSPRNFHRPQVQPKKKKFLQTVWELIALFFYVSINYLNKLVNLKTMVSHQTF